MNFVHDEDEVSQSEGEFDDKSVSDTSGVEVVSRDETMEVRKLSQKETSRVTFFRLAVILALLLTAISVTVTTYWLLVKQEDENFQNVFSQFARTVADSAVEQQKDLRSALVSLSNTISLSADLVDEGNPPWPYFFPPMFEAYAGDYLIASKAEFVGISNIVLHDERDSFVNFTTSVYQDEVKNAHLLKHGSLDLLDNDTAKYKPFITKKTADGFKEDDDRDMYFVRTIQSPPPQKYGPQINWNLASDLTIRANMDATMELRNETTISMIRPFVGLPASEHMGFHSDENADNPHCFAFHPVYKFVAESTSDIVAIMSTAIAFDASMRNLLPSNVKGMLCVVNNNCNQTLSYLIDGKDAVFRGETDLHDHKYDDISLEVDLALYTHPGLPSTPGHCMYKMKIYPTQAFEDDYKTDTPLIYACVVAGTFVLVALVYYTYDVMVQRRNESMIRNAAETNAVVTSIIPDHLRDRLLGQKKECSVPLRKNGNLKTFLADGSSKDGCAIDTPLADLFLDCTVLMADVAGFTAWASVREPTSVFLLLETIYQAFDNIAKKRRILKVETVGDCYVAVCGIPDPRRDHAIAMARFARDLMNKMRGLTKHLEVQLGPDTGELALRIGMHSGPVTAGVLRGERARFQLFGDTTNMASVITESSKPGHIQCSKETADLLIKLGKREWVTKRTDPLVLKGKGSLWAYWVRPDHVGSSAPSCSSDPLAASDAHIVFGAQFPDIDERTQRLIEWNVEVLLQIMKEIEARRQSGKKTQQSVAAESIQSVYKDTPLEEVREIIPLPEFDNKAKHHEVDPDQVEIPAKVTEQLHHFVSTIACLYHDNPFHNFQHASHVVMSVIKLMSRIKGPTNVMEEGSETNAAEAAATLHDHTYGITSDPMTQFACAFSALIHDVDHVGVSNAQLVKEGTPIAKHYVRSVAEQNSLDISWDLLMGPDYKTLRDYLFPTEYDLVHFRHLVVNAVMSTDIVDKDLKELRNARWDKAFNKNGTGGDSNDGPQNKRDEVNRKATIVIEHLIQASDISHTMQHWHVYRRWNQNFFEELYVAHLNGRMDKDPATFWYKGEFGFFDFYIIPLTRKLKECGVFGVSSDEYLNYAIKNREEWELRGEDVVKEMAEECRKKYGVKAPDGSIRMNGEPVVEAPPESAPRVTTKSLLDTFLDVETQVEV